MLIKYFLFILSAGRTSIYLRIFNKAIYYTPVSFILGNTEKKVEENKKKKETQSKRKNKKESKTKQKREIKGKRKKNKIKIYMKKETKKREK